MTTFTSSLATAGAQAKRLHSGSQTVRVRYNSGTGATLSDIILLCKLPNGAMVTDVQGTFGTGSTDSVLKLGWVGSDSGSATAFGTHTSSSTDGLTNFNITGEDIAPVHISFTDSTGSGVAYLYGTCSAGSFSASFSIDISVTYHLDHNEGAGS